MGSGVSTRTMKSVKEFRKKMLPLKQDAALKYVLEFKEESRIFESDLKSTITLLEEIVVRLQHLERERQIETASRPVINRWEKAVLFFSPPLQEGTENNELKAFIRKFIYNVCKDERTIILELQDILEKCELFWLDQIQKEGLWRTFVQAVAPNHEVVQEYPQHQQVEEYAYSQNQQALEIEYSQNQQALEIRLQNWDWQSEQYSCDPAITDQDQGPQSQQNQLVGVVTYQDQGPKNQQYQLDPAITDQDQRQQRQQFQPDPAITDQDERRQRQQFQPDPAITDQDERRQRQQFQPVPAIPHQYPGPQIIQKRDCKNRTIFFLCNKNMETAAEGLRNRIFNTDRDGSFVRVVTLDPQAIFLPYGDLPHANDITIVLLDGQMNRFQEEEKRLITKITCILNDIDA